MKWVTEVNYRSMGYSSVLICLVGFFQKSLAFKVHSALLGWKWFGSGDGCLTPELMTQLPSSSSLGTVLLSEHNRPSSCRANLFGASRVRIKPSAVNCRSIKTCWQPDLCCLVYLPSQQFGACCLWEQLSPFGLLGIHPCAKSTRTSWRLSLCPVAII